MCSRPKSSGVCSLPPIRYKVFEDAMLHHLEGINLARALGTDASRTKQVMLEREVVSLELELKKVKGEQEQLIKVITAGGSGHSFLAVHAGELHLKQTTLEQQIKSKSDERRSINLNDPESYKAMLDQLFEQLRASEATDIEALRRTLAGEVRNIVSRIRLSFESEADYNALANEDHVHAVGSDRGHVALVDYHSRMTQTLSIRTGKGLKLPWSDKHQWMKARFKA